MDDVYIKLPVAKKIEVHGYALFEKDWEYSFKKGLNLFVGGNRLGKTTTAYIILYGIIGLPLGSKSFFSDRVRDEEQTTGAPAVVKLDLQIGTEHVEIDRDLFDSSINYFSVNGRSFNRTDFPNIEELYSQEIVRLAGISSLSDYGFLLGKLLIREEEGNYLLWSPDDQMRVLRLLFNYGKFDKEFRILKDNVRKFDTQVRGQQDIQAQFKKRLKAIKQQKLESISRMGAIDLEELQKQHQLLESEANQLKSKYKHVINSIDNLERTRKNLTQAVYGISSEIEDLDAEIISIENKFFRSIYSDPKIQLANHKLKHYQICIFCNQKIAREKARYIVSEIEDNRKCPVCGSVFKPLSREEIDENEKKNLVQTLLEKRSIAEQKKSDLSVKQSELEKLTNILNGLRIEEGETKERLEEKILEVDDIRLRLSLPEMERKEYVAVYDRDIKALETQIQHYQGIIDTARAERQRATRALENKNREFSDRLTRIRDDLTAIFKGYADRFFGECELVAIKRRTDDSIVYTDIFVPKFDGRERISRLQVSNSEATFLEYAFRMSLCQLYKQITGNETLLTIETSEGLFDTVNMRILAEAISKFYDVSYLLVISNFGRPDFLKSLIEKSKPDISDRILNYFEIGKLSPAQQADRNRFNEQLREVLQN